MLTIMILAAGQSKRFQSSTSKVLYPLGGQPLISYLLQTCHTLKPDQLIMILSPSLENNPFFNSYQRIIQDQPLGTGHAIQQTLPFLPKEGDVIILCGDTPLITEETLKKIAQIDADICIALTDNPSPESSYGRIICDSQGMIQKIVEFKDATSQEKQSPWINGGIYKIKAPLLHSLLPTLANNNKTNEYYLTDLIEKAINQNYTVSSCYIPYQEMIGVNTKEDLAVAEHYLQKKWRYALMNKGVTLVSPDTVFLNFDTEIGADSSIGPHVHFGTNVWIDSFVTILPFCHITDAKIEAHSTIGPFAHIRGGTHIQEGANIGNFVEIKGSKIGPYAKAKHLSYLGDSIIEREVNIGAGTITCNYDGHQKHQTIIREKTHIGANTSLIAPLTIGINAIVGAGSVVTDDVPDYALAIARAKQINKKEWVYLRKKKS